jgi:hypothetical protein
MEKVEQRMASLSARMLETSLPDPSGPSTINSQPSTSVCGLGSIVASLNESVSRVLQLAQWWAEGGELDTQSAGFAMDTDLRARAMSGDEITAVVGAWRTGAISRDTMLELFKRREVLPDGRTVWQERALIHGKTGGER